MLLEAVISKRKRLPQNQAKAEWWMQSERRGRAFVIFCEHGGLRWVRVGWLASVSRSQNTDNQMAVVKEN